MNQQGKTEPQHKKGKKEKIGKKVASICKKKSLKERKHCMTSRIFHIKLVLFIFSAHGESWVRTKGQRPTRSSGLTGRERCIGTAAPKCTGRGSGRLTLTPGQKGSHWEVQTSTSSKELPCFNIHTWGKLLYNKYKHIAQSMTFFPTIVLI